MMLPEKVKIPGVTGLLHPLWIARWKGSRDGKTQVRQVEAGYSTPYIERVYGCLHTAVSRICRLSADRLEPVFTETARGLRELRALREAQPPEEFPPGEEGRRRAAERAAQQRADLLRERELVIRLEEQRKTIQAAEERLAHWCRQASAVTRTLLSSYWDGVLKTSDDRGLPPFPVEKDRELPGLASVRSQADCVVAQISDVLYEFEKGAEQNERTSAEAGQ